MVDDPKLWIKPFASAGASQLTFHWEAVAATSADNRRLSAVTLTSSSTTAAASTPSCATTAAAAIALAKTIREEYGLHAGLSVKPGSEIDDQVKEALDSKYFTTLLIMTVEPGFGGQSFMHDMMKKAMEARMRYKDRVIIQVDGGLTLETTKIAAAHGANAIVAGTSIYGSPDVGQCIADMHQTLRDHIGKFS
eukprot:GHVQ01043085.1.p1 GENE.GHVQ01043085.1~~GHVQ01043085.1.p1  ORF type:complete len:193 (-),score=32.31 GHVQ01043085.1:823-1401(-)